MSDNMEKDESIEEKDTKPGILAAVHLSDIECNDLLDYLDKTFPSLYASFVYVILGSENFLKFYDVLAGESIRVPTRTAMMSRIEYIKIYSYVKEKGFTSEAYEKAAKIFGRRNNQVRRIVEKVKGVLERNDLDE